LDIIVNNAGYTWDNVIQKMSDEQWDSILGVHLKAPFRIHARRAAVHQGESDRLPPQGRQHLLGVRGVRQRGPGELRRGEGRHDRLDETMAKEWGRYKVNVNAVAYGWILTRMTEASAEEDAFIEIEGRKIKVGINARLAEFGAKMIPFGRPGTPEEAAGAVYALCTQETNYVTAQCLVCDGGRN
jgi:3-oxoacyl-[acyl-carrier protein] reductase